jgi:hypothetical protein
VNALLALISIRVAEAASVVAKFIAEDPSVNPRSPPALLASIINALLAAIAEPAAIASPDAGVKSKSVVAS